MSDKYFQNHLYFDIDKIQHRNSLHINIIVNTWRGNLTLDIDKQFVSNILKLNNSQSSLVVKTCHTLQRSLKYLLKWI